MSVEILENMPHSLKLRYSHGTLGLFISLFLGSIIFLIASPMLVLSFINLAEKGSILIGSVSLFFTVIGALWVRSIFFSGHACLLHFDQNAKKLHCYPQAILRKLPAEEVPFVQLDKIEFQEKVNKDDDNNEYLTYNLTLKIKDKSIWVTPFWSLLWSSAKESQRYEVEKMARLISKITGIPYTFSTDKPLPEKS